MACTDPAITAALSALRTCTATQLGACNRPVCRFPIVVSGGHPPADACDCDCGGGASGQAWVRMVTLNRGGGTTNVAPCFNGVFDVTVELGVYRCAPTPATADSAVDEQVETDHAVGMYADMAALRRAVRCCSWFDKHDIDPVINHQSAIGPSGGCIGVELRATFPLVDCGCGDPLPSGTYPTPTGQALTLDTLSDVDGATAAKPATVLRKDSDGIWRPYPADTGTGGTTTARGDVIFLRDTAPPADTTSYATEDVWIDQQGYDVYRLENPDG